MQNALIAGYPIVLPEHRAEFHRQRPFWHKPWLDSIHESLDPGEWVLDIGAEQGDLSALIASWVPDGGMILVEPQPLYWPTIRETFEANGLCPPIESFVGFASDECLNIEDGIVEGWPAVSCGATHEQIGFYHLNEHLSVPSKQIDCLHASTAIIIDVEGAELRTLRGGEGWLADAHPLVWCAIHPEIMADRYGDDPNELLAYMYRLGYRWDLLAFQGEIHVKFTPR